MAVAPAGLLEARRLLLEHLDIQPGAHDADLDPAEVGVVPDRAHTGGYHCGRDRLHHNAQGVLRDYSVIEAARDRVGLSERASAMDIGWFEVRVGGKAHDLRDFSIWLVAQCKAGTPDTKDIREIIYSPDGKGVKRWDRLSRRTGGDSSHRWHTHISEFRDARGRHMPDLIRRWLTHIGLIDDAHTPGGDMPTAQDLLGADVDPGAKTYTLGGAVWTTLERTGRIQNVLVPQLTARLAGMEAAFAALARAVAVGDPLTAAELTTAVRRGVEAAEVTVDPAEIVEGVLAGLAARPITEVADALRAALSPDRIAELAAVLAQASA